MACDPDYWALVVGISHYPGLSGLAGPEQDAQDFFTWVTSLDGGRVCFDPAADPQKALLVLSSQFVPPAANAFDAKPTKEEVEKWLRRLHQIAKGRGDLKVGKRLYLYFAGHGFEAMRNVVDKNGEPVILMANAERDALEHVPARVWAELYFSAGYFDEVLLFVDCCREVKTDWPLTVPQVSPGQVDTAALRRFYAFATKSSKLSRERVIDGATHGLFTHVLMQALRSAEDASGRITAKAVKDWLFNKMPELVGGADGEVSKQPDIPYPQGDADDLVIVAGTQPTTFPVVVAVPGAAEGTPVAILDHRGQQLVAKPLMADATSKFDLQISSNGVLFKARCGARQALFEVPTSGPVTL